MFRLDIDGVSGSYVMTVAPVVVTTGLVETPPPSPLIVTVRSGPTVQAQQQFAQWQQWFASGVPRGGTLTFLGANLSPVLIERFSGLRVMSISSASGVSTVTIGMTGVGVEKTP
jgi:hypothetical protein